MADHLGEATVGGTDNNEMNAKQVEEVVGDILTYWFGIQFWSKGEPKNPTSHYDDLWRQK